MLPTHDPQLTDFTKWLVLMRAVRMDNTNQWEVQRWLTGSGHMILYTNAKGERKWSNSLGASRLAELTKAYEQHMAPPPADVAPASAPVLSARARRIQRGHAFKDKLVQRQEGECFFCGCAIATRPKMTDSTAMATVEHMVALVDGGPDSIQNMVAACSPCNAEAGTKSVWEKVKMRERMMARRRSNEQD